MFFLALDADRAIIDKAEILDIPFLFDELAEFGETGVAENGDGSAFFAGLVVDCDVDVMALHLVLLRL
jgi:hypothetical protein